MAQGVVAVCSWVLYEREHRIAAKRLSIPLGLPDITQCFGFVVFSACRSITATQRRLCWSWRKRDGFVSVIFVQLKTSLRRESDLTCLCRSSY